MKDLKIKHYKRVNERAAEKELVTELVEAGSETAQFLDKMEKKRLSKPCYQSLDMRGKVAGECRKYTLHDRTFFLDDASLEVFQESLNEYNGAYTVGVYEAVTNGQHTNKAQRQARERAAHAQHAAANPDTQRPADQSRGEDDRYGDYQPATVCFGYHQKRNEPRMFYVTAAEYTLNGRTYRAQTRDISPSGVRLALKGIGQAAVGQTLSVSFPALMEKTNVGLEGLSYTVVAARQAKTEFHIMAQLKEDRDLSRVKGYFDELIATTKHRYKLDVEDVYADVQARLYERLYLENTASIPFFIGKDAKGRHYVQAVARSDGNETTATFFQDNNGSYDLSPLWLPQRVAHILDKGEMLLVMYRKKDGNRYSIHSATDLDYPDAKVLRQVIRFALLQQEYCILKVLAAPIGADHISPSLVEAVTQRLNEKSPSEAQAMQKDISELVASGLMIDVTDQYRDMSGGDEAAAGIANKADSLTFWVGNAREELKSGKVVESVDSADLRKPTLVRFGYVESRKEDRYQTKTRVEVTIAGKTHIGHTVDLSTRGLRVQLDNPLDPKLGDEISVHLVTLQKKRAKLDLTKIPYTIVGKRPGKQAILMLERIPDPKLSYITGFFSEVIEQNQEKLKVCTEDVRNATYGTFYGSLLARNVTSMPFYISKNSEGLPVVSYVGITEQPAKLARFLMVGNGEYDLHMLTDKRLLYAIHEETSRMRRDAAGDGGRQAPCEFELYMYKHFDSAANAYRIEARSSMEFTSDAQLSAFVAKALEQEEYCFAKMMASYTLPLDSVEVDLITDIIRDNSRPKATQLRNDVQEVVGLGELIDITPEVLDAHQH